MWLNVEITRRLVDEHGIVTLDDNRQSLKQESCLANISMQLQHSAADPTHPENQVEMNPTGPEFRAQLAGKEDSV